MLLWESKEVLMCISGELLCVLVEILFMLGNVVFDNIDVVELGLGDVGIVKVIGINQFEVLLEEDSVVFVQQIVIVSVQIGYQVFIDFLCNVVDVKINLQFIRILIVLFRKVIYEWFFLCFFLWCCR